ncbi:unnamed protein product [Mytilus coruscus]|uniref:Uncharacterized protein n=1 Tax=Mytilus coruscus TaxID=42192 RepID=A0A6J7ZZ11_MYTCO|nr:unnamed protein product [Mytilus coruscus]
MSDEGFSKLQGCGGFELLRCQSNCRILEVISDLRDHLKDCDVYVQHVQPSEPFAETQSTSTVNLQTDSDSVDNSDEDLPDLYSPSLARHNNETTTEMTGQTENLLKQTINSCIDFCTENKVTDPVDILRHIQEKIVCGRDLDLADDPTTNDGETSFIMVDRDTLLQSAFEEIPALTDLRLTLPVQFYEEVL